MAKSESEDPIMQAARKALEASGLTYQQLGEKMGFPAASARQGAFQFLKGSDPRVGTVRLFAKALGIPLYRLLK